MLGDALARLGFSKLGPKMQACRAGDLIHAVYAGEDRHGGLQVRAIVWHACLAQGKRFTPSSIQSPLAGDVSPTGISDTWAWKPGELDPAVVSDLLAGFFGNFREVADLRRVVSMLDEPEQDDFRAALRKPHRDPAAEARIKGVANYAVPGGALSEKQSNERVAHLSSRLATRLGYEIASKEDMIAVHARGKMLDCFRVLQDRFGTYASIVCFPWTPAIWTADDRWEGLYQPTVQVDVTSANGSRWLAQVRDLEDVDVELLAEGIRQATAQFAAIVTARDFADRIQAQWPSIANSLRRAP